MFAVKVTAYYGHGQDYETELSRSLPERNEVLRLVGAMHTRANVFSSFNYAPNAEEAQEMCVSSSFVLVCARAHSTCASTWRHK